MINQDIIFLSGLKVFSFKHSDNFQLHLRKLHECKTKKILVPVDLSLKFYIYVCSGASAACGSTSDRNLSPPRPGRISPDVATAHYVRRTCMHICFNPIQSKGGGGGRNPSPPPSRFFSS